MSRALTKKVLKLKRKAEKAAARRKLNAAVEREQDQSTKFRAAEYAKLHGGRQTFDKFVHNMKFNLDKGNETFQVGWFQHLYNKTQAVFDITSIFDWCIEDTEYIGPDIFVGGNGKEVHDLYNDLEDGFYIRSIDGLEREHVRDSFLASVGNPEYVGNPDIGKILDDEPMLYIAMLLSTPKGKFLLPITYLSTQDYCCLHSIGVKITSDGHFAQFKAPEGSIMNPGRSYLEFIDTSKGLCYSDQCTVYCLYWLQKLTQVSNIEMSYIPESRQQTTKRIVQGLPKYKFGFIDIGMAPRPVDGVGKPSKTGRKLPLHKRRAHFKKCRWTGKQIFIDAYWAGNIKYGFVDRHSIIKPKHFPKHFPK